MQSLLWGDICDSQWLFRISFLLLHSELELLLDSLICWLCPQKQNPNRELKALASLPLLLVSGGLHDQQVSKIWEDWDTGQGLKYWLRFISDFYYLESLICWFWNIPVPVGFTWCLSRAKDQYWSVGLNPTGAHVSQKGRTTDSLSPSRASRGGHPFLFSCRQRISCPEQR